MARRARKVVAGAVEDFAPGARRIIDVGGRSIGVFRVDDRFYAIRNRCPHQGGPLCKGHVLGPAVAGAPGQAEVSTTGPLLACPWHGWEYDLETGASFMGAAAPGVRSYPVGVEPGHELAAALAEAGERTPGPYVAEIFDVSVEGEYVVVEV